MINIQLYLLSGQSYGGIKVFYENKMKKEERNNFVVWWFSTLPVSVTHNVEPVPLSSLVHHR